MRRLKANKINVGLDNAIQLITDSMANSLSIDINYEGSGNRSGILPYGWSVSKDNNLLLMCYKNDGSIRSYRLDRINELYVSDSLLQAYDNVNSESQDIQNEPDQYYVPLLPNIDEILEESENEISHPYDDAIEVLDDAQDINENIESIDPEELIQDEIQQDIQDDNQEILDLRDENQEMTDIIDEIPNMSDEELEDLAQELTSEEQQELLNEIDKME